MEKNNKKNILIIVALMLLLIITISGVTYAFFTYARSGSSNNTLRSGKISFSFTDGNSNISLTNAFPIAGTTGVALSGGSSSTSFTITGNTSTGNSITYAVWAIPGDTSSQAVLGSNYANYTSKFRDSEIYTHITKTSGGADFTGLTDSTKGTAVGDLLDDFEGLPVPSNGKLLGYGTITGTGSAVTADFTVRMWIDDSKVNICASGCTYTEGQYSHKYYTMKISVTATDGVYEISSNDDLIPSCPGCVFAYNDDWPYDDELDDYAYWWTTWNTESKTPTVLTSNDYVEDYKEILSQTWTDVFLGMILNNNHEITRAFACGRLNNVPFCIEGTKYGSKHGDNYLLLNSSDLYNGTCSGDSGSLVYCKRSMIAASDTDGDVRVYGNHSHCAVVDGGALYCDLG